MLALGDALALSLSERRGFGERDFAELHPGGSIGMRLAKVRDLMRTGSRVPRVAEDAPMTEAIHEMSRKMMGITAVVDAEGRLRGVISDGDLRRLLESDPAKLQSAAGACGRPNPRTIDGEEFASAALEAMRSNRITSLFVLDGGGRLEGAVHMHDLLERGLGEGS